MSLILNAEREAEWICFGRYLRDHRVQAGVSLRELARRLEMSPVQLGAMERGVSPPLVKERWPLILEAVPGTSLDELQIAAATRPRDERYPAGEKARDLLETLVERIASGDLSEAQAEELSMLLRNF